MSSRFRTVIFDCDSTLSGLEGVEELARDHRQEVARLTDLAMTGVLPLEEVYGHRLALIRPTREQVESVGQRYIETVVTGAQETVKALQNDGVTVQVLSGGLAPAVRILARYLGIADDRVAAVDVWFAMGGAYMGFDTDSPLARSGGKRQWIETVGHDLPRPILLVGDGATDLEARPAVDAFAAFTGVVTRDDIIREADVVLAGPSLASVLEYCGVR